MLSVSSSSSRPGARPVSPSTRSIMPIRSFCRNWRAERFTAIRSPGCRACQACACAQASSSTHSPSGMMSPVSSAIGMNSAGDSTRRSGCGQRSSASAPSMRAAGEVDQRLVVQGELAALERAPQVGLGREAAAHALGHLRAEELVVGAPRLLGVVHRRVGVAHQRLGGVAVGADTARCRCCRRRAAGARRS